MSPSIVYVGKGIGFRREKAGDRDAHGILWRRVISRPGHGRPEFKSVHLTRQRRAMGGLWCQVCGKPARGEGGDDGVLFLLGREEYDSGRWPEPVQTGQPPVCLPCARVAVNACPHLRGHFVAVRGKPRPYGVSGILYRPGGERPQVYGVQTVPYGDPRLPWTEASQLIVRLTTYQVVDLETEA